MSKIKVELQKEVSECGLASISMVASAYSTNISLSLLRDTYKLSKDGMSFFDIIRVFDDIGFLTNCYEVDIQNLRNLKLPAILFWNNSHFVVLESISGRDYHIIDPAFGRKLYTHVELSHFFSGIALDVEQKKYEKKLENNKRRLNSFSVLNIVKKNKSILGLFITNVMMLISIGVVSIFIPKLFPLLINEVFPSNDIEFMYLLVMIFGGLFLFKSISMTISTYIGYLIAIILNKSMVKDYYDKMISLPVPFFERRSPVQIIRYFNAVEYASNKITDGPISIIITLFFSFIFAGLMLYSNSVIGSILISSCILFMIIRIGLIHIVQSYHSKQIISEHERDQILIDTFDDICSVKLNCSEYKRGFSYNLKQIEVTQLKSKSNLLSNLGGNIHATINLMQGLVIAFLGTKYILNGTMTAGDMISIVLFKDLFMQNILDATDKYKSLRLINTELEYAEDINESYDKTEINLDENLMINKNMTIGDIVMSNVSFSYSSFDSAPVINNFSTKIPYGSKVIIHGKSGCGKSTLMRLISTLDKSDSGVITYNGMTAHSFGLRTLRSKIATVGINDRIITGSILDNIIGDSSDINIKRVNYIVNLMSLDFIKTSPAGYHTQLGRGGIILSMGQQQRIFLARALYKTPDLLLLDEPTSHLDPENAKLIKDIVKSLKCTVIVISHNENETGFDNEIFL